MLRPSEHTFSWFVGYIVVFFLLWTAYVAFLYPLIAALGVDTLLYALVNIGTRILIWIVPVFLYLRAVDGVNPFHYLKLVENWRIGLLWGLFITAVNFIGTVLRFGPPDFQHAFITWNSILSSSFAIGFVEEIPFRGFVLQKMREQFGWPLSIGLSSLLFMLFHVPGWILLGGLNAYAIISVFIIGMVLALALRYSRSLWSCIIAHSANDFLSVVLYHF